MNLEKVRSDLDTIRKNLEKETKELELLFQKPYLEVKNLIPEKEMLIQKIKEDYLSKNEKYNLLVILEEKNSMVPSGEIEYIQAIVLSEAETRFNLNISQSVVYDITDKSLIDVNYSDFDYSSIDYVMKELEKKEIFEQEYFRKYSIEIVLKIGNKYFIECQNK